MANPIRCEATLDVPGRASPLRLKWTWNAAVEFEQLVGHPITDALAHAAERRLSAVDLRGLLWAGLREHHGEITPRQVGEIIDQVGRVEATRIMSGALLYYFPEMDATADPPADPPKPPAST